MALALYRKYRPATFAEVVGQDHVTQPLRTALAAGRINHAYLFSGPRGCGKTSSARIMARSLNCVEGPTPDPCGVCSSCVALAPEGPGSLDVVELDAASHGGVDDTRDLRDRAFYMPAESRYRVFIIDEAHMVSPQGFNALLKIVEEPPEHLVFIFATTEPEKVMATIRSRTHHYPFRLIPPATLRKLLERLCAEEGVTVEPAVFPLVIQAGGGSARDSLSILDQLLAGAGPDGVGYRSAVALLGVTDAALLDEAVDALAANDGASVFGAVDKVVEAGHDPRRFGADLLQRFRDLVILAAVPDAVEKGLIDAPQDQITAMVGQAERLGAGTLTRMADVLHTGLTEMRGTTAPRLALELMCARMLLPAGSGDTGALVQRLERLEQAVAGGDLTRPSGPPADQTAARSTAARGAAARLPAEPTATTALPTPPPARVTPAVAATAAPSEPYVELVAAEPPPTRRRSAPTTPASGPSRRGTAPHSTRATQGLGLPDAPPAGRVPPAARADEWVPPDEPPDDEPPDDGTAAADRGRAPAARGSVGAPAAPAAPAAAAPAELRPTSDSTVPAAGGTPDTQQYDVTDVRRVWPEVLAAAKERRRTTQILLESATVAELSDGVLTLTMSSAGLARKVVEAGNADVLRQALKSVLGVDWAIRCHPPGVGRPEPELASRPAPAEDFEPDDEPGPADARGFTVHDPEATAIELLTRQVGARRVDAPG